MDKETKKALKEYKIVELSFNGMKAVKDQDDDDILIFIFETGSKYARKMKWSLFQKKESNGMIAHCISFILENTWEDIEITITKELYKDLKKKNELHIYEVRNNGIVGATYTLKYQN